MSNYGPDWCPDCKADKSDGGECFTRTGKDHRARTLWRMAYDEALRAARKPTPDHPAEDARCTCPKGPQVGAQLAGTPLACSRCGGLVAEDAREAGGGVVEVRRALVDVWNQGYEMQVRRLEPVVADLIAAAKREAWDEGWNAGFDDLKEYQPGGGDRLRANPYRALGGTAGEGEG